jgi:hypothetical protein
VKLAIDSINDAPIAASARAELVSLADRVIRRAA